MKSPDTTPIQRRRLVLATAAALARPAWARSTGRPADLQALLADTCAPLTRVYDLPGLVAGLIVEGRTALLASGVTALQGGRPVTPETLFELGSISKCFTALLAAAVHVNGRLDLAQPVGEIVPALRAAALGRATPLHLATYTAGGLPLQVPDDLTSSEQAMDWLAAFVPADAPGTVRRYSNPSIGLLGQASAMAMGQDFTALMEGALLAPLGLRNTHIRVPAAQQERYAWGHDRNQRQVRVNPGVFDAEAYGMKSTASDLLHFLRSVLDPERLPPDLRQALALTTVPRFQVGPMQQAMGWELYPQPASLAALQEGNGPRMVLEPMPALAIPPAPGRTPPMLLNKTGSTFGFSAYLALVPDRQAAFVLLANRNFPAAARVAAGYRVLAELGVVG